MKKTLLSFVAALGLATTAMAQMPQLYQKISGDAATRVYASQMSATDMETAVKAFDANRCWGGANFFYTTGETLYADDEITLAAQGQGDNGEMRVYDSTWGADVTAAQTFNDNINYLAIVGSSINKNVLDGTEIIDYSAPKTNFNAAGQGAIVVNVTKAGILTATASRGNNNTNIGIWQVSNEADKIEAQKILDAAEANEDLSEEEYQAEIARGNALKMGKWVAYTNFESSKDGSKNGIVNGNVDSEHTYLIVSLSKNNSYVHYVTFTPELKETWSVASIAEGFDGKTTPVVSADGKSATITASTENITMTYLSSPNEDNIAEGKTWIDLTGGGNQAYDDVFTHKIQGRGNPALTHEEYDEETAEGTAHRVLETYYEAGCKQLPIRGSYVEFETKADGVLDMILYVHRNNCQLMVVDEATKKEIAPSAFTIQGYFNNNTVVWGTNTEALSSIVMTDDYKVHVADAPNKQFFGSVKFNAAANTKYMVFIPTGQIYLYGFNFIPAGTSTAIEDVEVANPAATIKTNVIYNLAGQVVDENYKGIVIKNGKKYLMK